MKADIAYKKIHVRRLKNHGFRPERADFVLSGSPNGGHAGAADDDLYEDHYLTFSQVKELAQAEARSK